MLLYLLAPLFQAKLIKKTLFIGKAFAGESPVLSRLGAMLLGACRMLAIAILDWADEERLL